jgi:hypothetical protein
LFLDRTVAGAAVLSGGALPSECVARVDRADPAHLLLGGALVVWFAVAHGYINSCMI